MILARIACGNTSEIVKSVSQWPYTEVRLFVSELILCTFDPDLIGFVSRNISNRLLDVLTSIKNRPQLTRRKIHVELSKFYFDLGVGQDDRDEKLIKFIAHIIQISATSCQAVLNTLFLSILFRICVNLRQCCGSYDRTSREYGSSLWRHGDSVFSALALHVNGMSALSTLPVNMLWPKDLLLPLTTLTIIQVTDRGAAWRSLDLVLAQQRLSAIERAMFPWDNWLFYWASRTIPLDVFVDLLEFMR